MTITNKTTLQDIALAIKPIGEFSRVITQLNHSSDSEMKLYFELNERATIVDEDKELHDIICKKREKHHRCSDCVFYPSSECINIACSKNDRLDGISVYFIPYVKKSLNDLLDLED